MKPPRRTFATPFVVTVGLAGCSHEAPPPSATPRPIVTPDGATAVAPTQMTPDGGAVTPAPTPLDSPFDDDGATRWTVTMHTKGKTCELQYNMHCPPTASCNPPQPSRYACPAGMSTERRAFITQKAGETKCTLEFETTCGAEVGSCTQGPPARTIACPK